jgi:hypothetical protein
MRKAPDMTAPTTASIATKPAAAAKPTPAVTDDEIDAAIMTACERAWAKGRQVVAWASIRSRIPGGFWQVGERLFALHYAGRIDFYKFSGRNYLAQPVPGPVFDPRCYD